MTLFIMFYFFMDGPALLQRIKYLSPLHEEYENAIVSRFISISRATIKGTLLIGLLQGGLGALTLWICGVDSPVLWGVVMVILSIIPMVGAWMVMHPAAIIQVMTGHIWQGIAIFLITILVISNVDNILRPRLVGQDAGMHDLMIFFSTLGGISLFGAMGFIVGPVVAAFFLTILDIYSTEFKFHLDLAQSGTPSDETAGANDSVENSQSSQVK
jgi:predicted PurR-regulated permease PerM